jgi:PHD/YefM family antitoxin component YafN of YafNO toxin-antitoxin module
MTNLNASQARIPTKAFNNVVYRGERIRIQRRGGESVVLVSEADLQLLEALENHLDAEAARRTLAEMEEKGETPIPWEIVKKKLGL